MRNFLAWPIYMGTFIVVWVGVILGFDALGWSRDALTVAAMVLVSIFVVTRLVLRERHREDKPGRHAAHS